MGSPPSREESAGGGAGERRRRFSNHREGGWRRGEAEDLSCGSYKASERSIDDPAFYSRGAAKFIFLEEREAGEVQAFGTEAGRALRSAVDP